MFLTECRFVYRDGKQKGTQTFFTKGKMGAQLTVLNRHCLQQVAILGVGLGAGGTRCVEASSLWSFCPVGVTPRPVKTNLAHQPVHGAPEPPNTQGVPSHGSTWFLAFCANIFMDMPVVSRHHRHLSREMTMAGAYRAG